MTNHSPMTVAMLLSCDSFESFFTRILQLDRDTYLKTYRNDWSWYYARGLVENGIRPILYMPSILHDGLYETDEGIGVRFLQFARWYRPFAPLRRAMRGTRWSLYAQERVNAAAFIKLLKRSLADDGADLLYVQEYWGGRFDHLAHRVPIPISAADHGGLSDGVVKWFKRSAFKQAAALYCQTADECSKVEQYGGTPTLQPNGGDTSFFSPPPPQTQRGKNIVTVARLTDKQKRTSDLIRAMKLLPAEWTLDIIGTGPDQEMLQTLAKTTGVLSRITFHGFKSREQIRDFHQHCGVYAMPSANEAICLAMLEAMACGAPVVATKIRSFETIVTDQINGRLFAVGDVAGLAESIQWAWEHREALSVAAVASVSDRFNAKTLYSQLAHSMRHSCLEPSVQPEWLRQQVVA